VQHQTQLRSFVQSIVPDFATTDDVLQDASNLSKASAHTCQNLPILLAGGGFEHKGHVLHDRKDNTPLSNLYVRMLQQLGIEAVSFGASTGVLSEV
jgi:hypothetical protein